MPAQRSWHRLNLHFDWIPDVIRHSFIGSAEFSRCDPNYRELIVVESYPSPDNRRVGGKSLRPKSVAEHCNRTLPRRSTVFFVDEPAKSGMDSQYREVVFCDEISTKSFG